MGIMVNNKLYEFNLDIRLGILEMMEKAENLTLKHIRMLLKEILRPKPKPKELFNIKKSQFEKILEEFGKEMEKETEEAKKKLST